MGAFFQKMWDIRGEDGIGAGLRGGRGDVKATTAAAETVKVVHEHYSRVGQREAASHTLAQLGMMGFQSYRWRLRNNFHAAELKLKEKEKQLYLHPLVCCPAVCAKNVCYFQFLLIIFFVYIKRSTNGIDNIDNCVNLQ